MYTVVSTTRSAPHLGKLIQQTPKPKQLGEYIGIGNGSKVRGPQVKQKWMVWKTQRR